MYFDAASTTACSKKAIELLARFSAKENGEYGNPASSHAFAQKAAGAIREARLFFARAFNVETEQVVFTSGGTEANNLALYGVAMSAYLSRAKHAGKVTDPPRVLIGSTEHASIYETARSLEPFGIEVKLIPVQKNGQIWLEKYFDLLSPSTVLVSIHHVNNITGATLPIEELAKFSKDRAPDVIFHSDAVQAFGKIPPPRSPSYIDTLSLSAHKVEGPKGVGALVLLNNAVSKMLRPIIWGGGQENNLRSGTQSPGLIAAFHAAAESALQDREAFFSQATTLRNHLRSELERIGLLASDRAQDAGPFARKGPEGHATWNSPQNAVPHIVSLSFPGLSAAPLARLIEERGCIVSTGSACSSYRFSGRSSGKSSGRNQPERTLKEMDLPNNVQDSALRISFSRSNSIEEVSVLVNEAIADSVRQMRKLGATQ